MDIIRDIIRASKLLGDYQELFSKVKEMREAQCNFFEYRTKEYLGQSKKLEREVDKMIEYIELKRNALSTQKELEL